MLLETDISKLLEHIFRTEYVVQNVSELELLTIMVSSLEPTVIIEIGIEQGGTLKVWEQLLEQNKDSILIGIDINPSPKWDINKSNVSIFIIRGNSHDMSTLEQVQKILNDRNMKTVDFVYIDGEHTNEAAKKDFELYGKLVRPGGLVGFHDTNDIENFLASLPQDRLEIFHNQSRYAELGIQSPIGTGVYHVD